MSGHIEYHNGFPVWVDEETRFVTSYTSIRKNFLRYVNLSLERNVLVTELLPADHGWSYRGYHQTIYSISR